MRNHAAITPVRHNQDNACAPCADKGFEYEMLQGKTGAAVNDLYTPEIKAATTGYDTNNPCVDELVPVMSARLIICMRLTAAG